MTKLPPHLLLDHKKAINQCGTNQIFHRSAFSPSSSSRSKEPAISSSSPSSCYFPSASSSSSRSDSLGRGYYDVRDFIKVWCRKIWQQCIMDFICEGSYLTLVSYVCSIFLFLLSFSMTSSSSERNIEEEISMLNVEVILSTLSCVVFGLLVGMQLSVRTASLNNNSNNKNTDFHHHHHHRNRCRFSFSSLISTIYWIVSVLTGALIVGYLFVTCSSILFSCFTIHRNNSINSINNNVFDTKEKLLAIKQLKLFTHYIYYIDFISYIFQVLDLIGDQISLMSTPRLEEFANKFLGMTFRQFIMNVLPFLHPSWFRIWVLPHFKKIEPILMKLRFFTTHSNNKSYQNFFFNGSFVVTLGDLASRFVTFSTFSSSKNSAHTVTSTRSTAASNLASPRGSTTHVM